MGSIVITSLPLKRLTLQVYAPKLLFFFYAGMEKVKLRLNLKKTVDRSFFINMREALSLSSKFDIDIEDSSHHALVSSKTKVDDERPRKRALFFDAFISICHPSYVKLKGNKCFTKMMVKEMMKKKTTDLKDVA
ncbi:hypothetical protein Tco_0292648, partial [Tanacetum coccineum]